MESQKVLFLSHTDVQACDIDNMPENISVIEEALCLHQRGKTVQPLKPYLRWPDETGALPNRIIAMPAYIGGDFQVAGVKWIGSFPANHRLGLPRASATIILNDTATGFPIAIMEGSLISAARTGAVTGISVKFLAPRQEKHIIALLGAGVISRWNARAIKTQIEIDELRIFDMQKERAIAFREEMGEELDLPISVQNSADATVRGADIIVPATTAGEPYIAADWVKQDALICNISLGDVLPETILKSKIVVDDWAQANREGKVIHQMYQDGLISESDIYAELGEIVSGLKPGRTEKDANTSFYVNPMGMAIEDIALAQKMYQTAIQRSRGTYLSWF